MFVGHHEHVDGAGPLDRPVPDAAAEERGEPAAAARAQHDLGDVLGLRELQQRLGDVVACGLVIAPAQRLHQLALGCEGGLTPMGEAVARDHMQRQQLAAGDAGRDPGRAADQGVALGAAGEGDHDALAGLPGGGDALLGAVALKPFLDAVGEPQQGELP